VCTEGDPRSERGGVTVRERIAAIHQQQLRGATTPMEAAQWLATLGALVGNVLQEIREAEADYNTIYAGFLDSEQKANRAKVRAESTPEYWRLREARDTLKVVESMSASLKYVLKAHEAEMRLTR
jgi:hypothetical protein